MTPSALPRPRFSRIRPGPNSPARTVFGVAGTWLVLLVALSPAILLRADVRCPAIFGDHLVLQRELPVPIWGWAEPGESVTVTFLDQVQHTKADAIGHWEITLAPLATNSAPETLTIRGKNELQFSDVLVGEVWLCSGQSNMEKPFGSRRGQKPTENSDAEIAAAAHPNLRLFQVPHSGRAEPNDRSLQWQRCSPESLAATHFSAVAYVFGSELLAALDVPVGVIHASFGGTRIEAWLPPAVIAARPELREIEHLRYDAWVPGVQPTELFLSMVAPAAPYALRGFLWYQGETNCMAADCGPAYTAKLRALIASWRAAWGRADAPFYFAQVAPFDYSQWTTFAALLTPEALPSLWEAQARALAEPHTGLVVLTDLVSDLHDIHPPRKRPIGERFARLALAETYGQANLIAQGPEFVAASPRAGGEFELRFAHAHGLRSRDGHPLDHFALAGADRVFHPAQAKIEGDRVVLTSPAVSEPVAARFAWHETATPNLVNAAGLPAVPFRTDDWPVVLERPRPAGPLAPKVP